MKHGMPRAQQTNSAMCSVLEILAPAFVGAIFGFLISLQTLTGQDHIMNYVSDQDDNLLTDVVDKDEHNGGEEEANFDRAMESSAVIILVLIILTIAFEKIKHSVEESAHRSLKPIIQSLFGEITVLGFLSLFTFCITKLGVFKELSIDYFGEDSEKLQELFESVHFTLFFVMVLFLFQVIHILHESTKTQMEWLELDYARMDQEYIEELSKILLSSSYSDVASPNTRLDKCSFIRAISPSLRAQRHETILDELNFYAFRNEFILERSLEHPFEPAKKEHRVPDDFNFGRYLSLSLGKNLGHSVHLSITVWVLVAVFEIIFFAIVIIIKNNMVVISWIWVTVGFLFMLYTIYVDHRLEAIERNFASFEHPDRSEPPYIEPLLNESLPPWCKIDLQKYLDNRPFLLRKIDKTKHPNRQDALYAFGRKGPKAITFFFQFNLLFTSLYIAILLFNFAPYMHKNTTVAVFVIYLVLSIAPIVVLLMQRRHFIASMVMVTSVGIHRKPQIVGAVGKEAKTAKIVRGFIMVNQMIDKVNDGFFDKTIVYDDELVESLSPSQRLKIEKVFDGFDESGDGYISASELGDVFRNIGVPLTDEVLEKVVKALDADASGDISKDEFLRFYVCHIMPNDNEESLEQRARGLFRMFDTSNDGEITIGEMKSALDAFNFGFTLDEVGELIQELDENADGTVGVDEFYHMLDTYKNQIKIIKRKDIPRP